MGANRDSMGDSPVGDAEKQDGLFDGDRRVEVEGAQDGPNDVGQKNASHVTVVFEEQELFEYGRLPELPRVEAKRPMKDLEWKDLSAEVSGSCGKEGKVILHPSSGHVGPGEFVAIMGPSGAGKTTLLNLLAGRVGKLKTTGSLFLGGTARDWKDMRDESVYVMQEDALYATATVKESLDFSAALRLEAEITDQRRQEIVKEIISAMGLEKAANTMVGNTMIKGVSGGEKKRTAIGIELLSDPNIIFLDEPTSGLDSYAAFKIVSLLKTLCNTGCMVIATIHQPSSEVFALFDRAFLMADGKTIYDGPVANVPAYFAMLDKPCPDNYNAADHVMFVMQMAGKERLLKLHDVWEGNKKAYQTPIPAQAERALAWGDSNVTTQIYKKRSRMQQFFREVRYLGVRELRNLSRDRVSIVAALGTTIFINLIVGLIFQKQGDWGPPPYEGIDLSQYPDATKAQILNNSVALNPKDAVLFGDNQKAFNRQLLNHFGAVTIVVIGGLFGLSQPTILNFPLERPIFIREYANKNYSWATYFLSKLPKEFLVCLMQSTVLVFVSYFLIGFKGNFAFIVLTVCLLGLSVSSCAMLLGALSSNVKAAVQLSPLILVPQLLFSGYQLPISSIPVWLRWAQYLCSLKYAVALFNIIEFSEPISPPDPTSRKQLDEFLKTQDTDKSLWYIYVAVLVGIFLGFRFIAMLALAAKAR